MKYSVLASLILILGFIGLGIMHENVHVEILRSYGVDSHIEYFSHFPDIVTIQEKPCPNEACILANNLNEVIGYPLLVFYIIFGILLLVTIIQKETSTPIG